MVFKIDITPMDYIKENVHITSSRRLLYNCIFNRHKVEFEEEDEQERIMSGKVSLITPCIQYTFYYLI